MRRRQKTRFDVEVTVSDIGHPSARIAVQHQPERGVEVDAVALEVLEDHAEGPDASHPSGGGEPGFQSNERTPP
jgi:hypothetical protein